MIAAREKKECDWLEIVIAKNALIERDMVTRIRVKIKDSQKKFQTRSQRNKLL